MYYHDNHLLKFKKPFGAVKEGTKVYLRLDVDRKYKSCLVRLWTPNKQEKIFNMDFKDNYYETEIVIDTIGLNWYLFIIQDFNGKIEFYCSKKTYTSGEGETLSYFPNDRSYQITCYDKDFEVPKWFENKIIYQIFPDRFNRNYSYKFDERKYEIIHKDFNEQLGCTRYGANNHEFYAGNLLGIEDKLDYLKELNVGVIYLNPIFKSTSNHRYDVTTFMEIDEMLGNDDSLRSLINKAHEKGIKIILDISFNHTGSDSYYFDKFNKYNTNGAYRNVNSPYRQWYNIYNNGKYECWWGFDTLPVLNKSNNSYRQHVKEIIKKYTDLGIDGWRLDVIDDLPDDFLEFLRKEVKKVNKDLVIFGECWDDCTLKQNQFGFRQYLLGRSQDGVMNYELRRLLVSFITFGVKEKEVNNFNLDAYELKDRIINLFNNYPVECLKSCMNLLSSHDINRILTVLSNCEDVSHLSKEQQKNYVLSDFDYEIGKNRLKMLWLILMFLPGNPSLFYGDETGLYGYNDPYNRKPMNWNNIDNSLLEFFKESNKYIDDDVIRNGELTIIPNDKNTIKFIRSKNNNKYVLTIDRKCQTFKLEKF